MDSLYCIRNGCGLCNMCKSCGVTKLCEFCHKLLQYSSVNNDKVLIPEKYNRNSLTILPATVSSSFDKKTEEPYENENTSEMSDKLNIVLSNMQNELGYTSTTHKIIVVFLTLLLLYIMFTRN